MQYSERYYLIDTGLRRTVDPIENKDIRGLTRFMDKHEVDESIVVTKNLRDERTVRGNRVRFIPLWEFLLDKKT